MKTKVHFPLLLVTLVMLLASCSNMISVEKRKYRKGFYIEHVSKPNYYSNSIHPAGETDHPARPGIINQPKEDSLPGEKMNDSKNVVHAKVATPGKSKNKIPSTTQKKKIGKANPRSPVRPGKQVLRKSHLSDDGEAGAMIFIVIMASVIVGGILGLGLLALYILGLEMALFMFLGCLFVIAMIDFFAIRSILKNRGK